MKQNNKIMSLVIISIMLMSLISTYAFAQTSYSTVIINSNGWSVSKDSTDNYYLTFVNTEGIQYNSVNFIASGKVVLLNYVDPTSDSDFRIQKGNMFVLTSALQFTHVVRYDSIDPTNRVLTFTDLGTGTRQVTYDEQGQGQMIVAGVTHRFRVSSAPYYSLAIDLNGDNTWSGQQIKIVTSTHEIIDVDDLVNKIRNGVVQSQPMVNLTNTTQITSALSGNVIETVKCVFSGSSKEEKCLNNQDTGCSGIGTCLTTIQGKAGEQVTWKSTCGGYAYTTIDGQAEYAKFNCETLQPIVQQIIQTVNYTPQYTANSVVHILNEGAKQTYNIGNKQYEVEVLVISETSNNGAGSIKLKINGQITNELKNGDKQTLTDGTIIEIGSILIQENAVKFKLETEAIQTPIIQQTSVTQSQISYPSFFSGKIPLIVVGDTAPSSDVMAAVNIATSIGAKRIKAVSKLTSEIKDIMQEDAILVGNSCTNPLINSLVGDITGCSTMKKGVGVVELVYHPTGKASVIVAGSSPEMTYLATTVLAKYSELILENKIVYPLPGINQFSTGAPVNSIDVQPTNSVSVQPAPVQVIQQNQACNGCEVNNRCLSLGVRLIDDKVMLAYCDWDKTFKAQKQENQACQNNYECVSNSCAGGKCQNVEKRIQAVEKQLKEQQTILQKIMDFFKSIFGG